ncbi:MAG: S46 family peptidase, partial [Bacteroidales bacterium]|nr:S46 family peptidase [Bacteroidales bacterium]
SHRLFLILFLALSPSLISFHSSADEGMWLVNAISRSLELKMQHKGLHLGANVIYNEDSTSLADAIVSLDFSCTGSIISGKGLLITNHHCAYSDLNALSTPDRNLLEDGYWAMNASDEIPIKGKGAWFLHMVVDVTEEYDGLVDSLQKAGQNSGGRRCNFLIEKRYKKKYPGYEASVSSFWAGAKRYMALYKVYRDVRLVGAPPVSVAAFGGAIDNWEWPQQKGDFALYRVYTAPDGSPAGYSVDNVPMVSSSSLTISLNGLHEGDFTMVMGYPGLTDRYSSSFEVDRSDDIQSPIIAGERKQMMKIIDEAMDKDPLVRLKYSDYYFELSNFQELYEDQSACCKRFGVSDEKRGEEMRMRKHMSGEKEGCGFGALLDSMRLFYSRTDSIEREVQYYRETIVRGTRIMYLVYNVEQCYPYRDTGDSAIVVEDVPGRRDIAAKADATYDLPLEKKLLTLALKNFYANVEPSLWGNFLYSEYYKCGENPDSVANGIWKRSVFTDKGRFADAVGTPHPRAFYAEDPLTRTFRSPQMMSFNRRMQRDARGGNEFDLTRKYKRARYRMFRSTGNDLYPDANSTMRLSYGAVSEVRPKDAVICADHTTSAGLLQKYDPAKYEYAIKPDFLELVEKDDWGRYLDGDGTMHIDFLTDNDITGGNSGSPVLDGYGRLVGLAFDGNRESMASRYSYTEGYNRCVCVDIRYVVWIIDRYAHLKRIMDELAFDQEEAL